jgi:hypothetical protein
MMIGIGMPIIQSSKPLNMTISWVMLPLVCQGNSGASRLFHFSAAKRLTDMRRNIIRHLRGGKLKAANTVAGLNGRIRSLAWCS